MQHPDCRGCNSVYHLHFPIYILFSILLGTGCQDQIASTENEPSRLYQPPLSVPLKTADGYAINPFTGDSLWGVLNSLGDTIQSGVPIPCQGIVMSGPEIKPPVAVPAGTPIPHVAHPNVHPLRQPPQRIMIDTSMLVRRRLGQGNPDATVVNSFGDTIMTGVPLEITGRVVDGIPPTLITALPTGVKDAAIADLTYLDEDQGLPSSYIMRIFQDSRGELWFGTNGGGVCRYDGVFIRQYSEPQGLPYNQVWNILEDRDGKMWFGTNGGGICVYDGNTLTIFGEQEGVPNGAIKSMFIDRDGALWFGPNGGGVCKLEYEAISFPKARITTYAAREGLLARSVTSIIQDRNQLMWFGTYNNGIWSFDGETFTQYNKDNGLAENIVWSMLLDDNGKLYCSAYGGGISIFDGRSFTNIGQAEGITETRSYQMTLDDVGRLWYTTEGNGVGMYDGEHIIELREAEGLTRNITWSLAKDNAGDVVIGTIAGGVNFYNPNSFRHIGGAQGLPGTFVFDITEDQAGHIWFATDAGACRYDGETMTVYTTEHGMIFDVVTHVCADHLGRIWFGTYGAGACMYDGTRFTHYTTAQGLSDDVVNDITEDADGNIWFATLNGISVFDGSTFTNYNETTGLSGPGVYTIRQDNAGEMWFATSGRGISKYNHGMITHYMMTVGLPMDKVWCAIPDGHGAIWVGTDGEGLCRFDGAQFTQYSTAQGIPSSTIWSVVEDPGGGVWAGTDNGLARVTMTADPVDATVLPMNKEDGLRGLAFNTNSVFIDSRQRAWWGGGKGLEMLDLKTFAPAQDPPTPRLVNLEINGTSLDFRGDRDSLTTDMRYDTVIAFENVPADPVLPYRQNHLTFHFSATDWHAQGKVRYSYRIRGLHGGWSQPSEEPKADYRNLPYGDYTFELRTIGESGEWSPALEYTFTIQPPWWHTWWARALYLIAAILVVIGIVRWRTATLKARAVQLQEEVDKATVTIRQQKAQVEQEKERSEALLLNILPAEVAEELKEKGASDAKHFDEVTVIFTDFKGFTNISEQLSPAELVSEIDTCFRAFDAIIGKYQIEKIKTIGDAYMAAGGLPVPDPKNTVHVIEAAIAIRNYMWMRSTERARAGLPFFEIRIGIHTGPVVAGIVGIKKFQYDIWGDTVNTASRMESTSEIGKINISEFTYQLIRENERYVCTPRGKVFVKGKGEMETYFIDLKRSLR